MWKPIRRLCLISPFLCLTCSHRSPAGCGRIALTTPLIWASMDINIRQYYFGSRLQEQVYKALSRRITEWFARSGGLPLTLFIRDPSRGLLRGDTLKAHSADILLDTLFSYSALWKNIHFDSSCEDLSIPILRVLALKAADVPHPSVIYPST